jgi:hypothetical protein
MKLNIWNDVNFLGELINNQNIDSYVRFRMILRLKELSDSKSVTFLINALSDPNCDVCHSAAFVLGEQRSKEAIRPLIKLLGNKKAPSSHPRCTAANSLIKIGLPDLIRPELEKLVFDDPDWLTLFLVEKILKEWNDFETLKYLANDLDIELRFFGEPK